MARSYRNQRRQKPVVHNWAAKLAQGEAFEKRGIALLKAHGHQAWKPQESRYDLRINLEVPLYGTVPLTGECKYDAAASRAASTPKDLTLTSGFTASAARHGSSAPNSYKA